MRLLQRPVPILIAALVLAALVLILFTAQPWSSGTFAGSPAIQGDTDCDDDADSVDALWVLQDVAGIDNDAGCVGTSGDTDCSGGIEATDGLHILRFTAALPNEAPGGCTPVGEDLPNHTPVPTDSPGPTLTITPTPKGQTPTPTSTPTTSPTGTKPPQTATPTPTPVPTIQPSPTPTPICYEPNDPGRAAAPVSGAGAPLPGGYDLVAFIPSFDTDFDRPIEFQIIPGSNDEAIVALQKTREIYRVSITNAHQPILYGNLSGIVPSGGSDEEGLLSVAFSPDFLQDDRVYVYFTNNSGQPTELGRLEVISNLIDPGTYDEIIQIPDTQNNHNGGHIVFQNHEFADGYLYLSLGDGGGAGDPGENAQDLNDLRGKVIRLDVSGDGPGYSIPADNPFVGRPGRDEIWACGFRNPWRMSTDRLNGDLWLGDVGQGDWEEVDRVVKGGNFGWDCYEGDDTFELSGCPPASIMTFPRAVYPNQNTDNQAVVGGFVYRGTDMPELYGWYVYADTYSGRIWAVNTAGSSDPVELIDTEHIITSFGELPSGELVVVTFDAALFTLVPD